MIHAIICLVALLVMPAGAEDVLFQASLETSTKAEFARGDPEPLVADGIRFQDGAQMPPNARLTYDARGNLYAEQATVRFRWRPDGPPGRLSFPIFAASYEQHSTWDFNFARIEWSGSQLVARVRDRNLQYHAVRAAGAKPVEAEWLQLELSWSEADGVVFSVNGTVAGRAPGPLALDARLDQFGFLTRAVSPHNTAGNENPGKIRDVSISVATPRPLPPGARYGWNDAANVPAASTARVKRAPVVEAKDLGKFWLKGVDAKRETTWPMVGHGYADEGKSYRIRPSPEPVNLIRTTGNLGARVTLNGMSYERPSSGELHYQRLESPAAISELKIERQSGVLGDLEFLLVEETPSVEGEWGRLAAAGPMRFRGRRNPASTANHRYFAIPAREETALDAIRIRWDSVPGNYYRVAVQDPGNEARHVLEADVRAREARLELTLDFPDLIVPAGGEVVLVLACSGAPPAEVEVQAVAADMETARAAHLAERVLEIRDSFQMLSEARPWMQLSSRFPLAMLRRQLKLVDELYALLEDARRLDPNHAVANGYWSWINRAEAPPPFEEPPPPDPSVPLWAHRQLTLLRHFRQVVDWWIDTRQIETGEMGGGLGDDTDMVQNWPGIALLDGPVEKIGKSLRAVLEACYARGMIERGMNTMRTDALHAYEEGMNAYAPAFLLDYGNPVLFERMMETASHYPRLTGVNAQGHRHFRSYQYSVTDLVEEGYHAREDIYSHLLYHPGLYVAWYNGSPAVTELLAEAGDALLAHWQTERYPELAKAIFFADDRVAGRSTPNVETYSLIWALFDLTGDERYLWLLREAVRTGDFGRAAAVNAPWLHLFPTDDLKSRLIADARRRNINDHNLQTDQGGLVARVLAWQASGDRSFIDDAHAALLRHMAQNMYLYTEAEQFTDRIWIPTMSVQRERLGGVAHYRNYIYPGHAVSWENTGGEVAVLVDSARPDHLRFTAYNAGRQARTATARVWMLDNGHYEISLRNEDGSLRQSRISRLKRYSPVELELPARTAVLVEFRQLEKGAPLETLPDLAIAAEEVRDNQGLEVPVHNIGAVASGPYTVSVFDEAGKSLGRSTQGTLAAPADLAPKAATVRFPGVARRAGLRIVVEPDGGREEICEANNAAVVAR